MSELSLRAVQVAVDGGEEGGLLVLADQVLVAVLICLADPIYQADQGGWHLEAGFGRCAVRQKDTFARLEDALRWVATHLCLDADAVVAPALARFGPIRPCA